MDVSDQMLEAVANAKKQAKAAERQFDLAAEMVNIKSSSSIDLFGGRAVLGINARSAVPSFIEPKSKHACGKRSHGND